MLDSYFNYTKKSNLVGNFNAIFGPPCISLIYITDIFVQTLIGPIFIVASVVFRWFFSD